MKKVEYKNIIFDLDSTLVRIEGLDELARRKGKYDEVAKLTRLSMEGKIDFGRSLIKKMGIISPHQKDMEWLGKYYIKNLVHGARKLIISLELINKEIYMITGNFRPAVFPVARYLRIKDSNIFCNDIFFDSRGKYKGFTSRYYLSRKRGKAKLIKSLRLEGATVLIGDGSTDLEAKKVVDLFIGFIGVIGRKIVKDNADCLVREMSSLLPIIKRL